MPFPRLALVSALAVIAALSAAAITVLPTDAVATTGTSVEGDVLTLLGVDGRVGGVITPDAEFTVDLVRDGHLKATRRGRADSAGRWNTSIGYDSGRTWGIHNGDVVRLRDLAAGRVAELERRMDAALDEMSGVLVGTTFPRASIALELYTNGDRAQKIGTTRVTADATGVFRVDLGSVFGIRPANWRGYQAELVSRPEIPLGRSAWHTVQTWNTTLTATRAQAGGGYFLAGTPVRFELVRSNQTVEAIDTTADADGIPRAHFASPTAAGDVLRTHWRWIDGSARSQELEPFDLTAVIDPATGTISGRTAPGAQVATWYYGDGDAPVRSSARAGADGRWSASLPSPVGDRLVVVWRVADPGRTGVGNQQVELRTPGLRLDDRTGDVTGYGPAGRASVAVALVRNGITLSRITTTSAPDGGFLARLGVEVLAGDEVRADSAGLTLAPLQIKRTLSASLRPDGTFGGMATPGRTVSVGTGTTTVGTTVVAADGGWSIPLPDAARSWLLVREIVPKSEGAAAGSSVQHWEHARAPEITLTSPTTATAFDVDDNAPPSTVWFHLRGRGVDRWIEDTTAPYAIVAPTTPGTYVVQAYAYDAGRRTDGGKAVYDLTPPRPFTVG